MPEHDSPRAVLYLLQRRHSVNANFVPGQQVTPLRELRCVLLAYAAFFVALLALGFTVGSFWWLHARRGSLTATPPRSYAFANRVRLRLPLAFFNTGATALIVGDLRLVIENQSSRTPLRWISTRTTLRPEKEDGFAFAAPFSVRGRATKDVLAEFGDELGWTPEPSSNHRMRLEAQIHPSEEWRNVVEFVWWAPPSADIMKQYIAHRNELESRG